MESTSSFGYWLRRRRKALDLTQAELARRVACSLELIQKIEADARRPSRQVAERLADALHVEPAERAAFTQAARGERATFHLDLPDHPVGFPQPALPEGTVTLLFADLADSARLWAHHATRMRGATEAYAATLSRAVAEHRGVVFNTLGDSLVAAFAHAPDAVAAAVAAQRALQATPSGLSELIAARIALHAGDLEPAGGAYAGPPMSRGARLLAVARGGQILLSLAVEELVREQLPPGQALIDLGSHTLAGLGAVEHIFQLAAPGLPAAFPPLATPEARRAALPAQPTPLVGRESEVAAICGLLHDPSRRLITLTGPGGVGKTRLGLQAAAELAAHFDDGLTFVDLAPVRDPAFVATAIAQALGVPEYGPRPAQELIKDALRPQRRLLLLDNFEQVADAATLVAEILAAAPGVKALVTSRVALNLRGEHEFRVEPLAFADPADLPALEALSQYAAVKLLIERAADARPGFAVTAENAPALAEICVRLDGLPLAIELAAARLRALAPEALLARIERTVRGATLSVLVDGPRDLPARQQTLRDTIAWSYNLLTPAEQALFRGLGVFASGCTPEAAAALCAPDADALGGLASLVGHSLLRETTGASGAARYVLLETIREYALDRLEAAGELPDAARRHALYFLDMAEATAQALLWGKRDEAREAAQADEIDNLRAAMAWALARPEEPSIHLRLGSALKDFWWYFGLLSDSRPWRAALLELPDGHDPRLLARALVLGGDMAWGQGEYAHARALGARALGLAAASGDRWLEAFAHSVIGKAAAGEGDYATGATAFQRSLSGFRALDDTTGVAWSLLFLGNCALAQGDPARARGCFREALDRFTAAANFGGVTEATIGLAEAAIEQGDLVRAALLVNGEGWADQGELAPSAPIAAGELIADTARGLEAGAAQARAQQLQARSAETLASGGWLPFFYGPLFSMMGRIALEQGDKQQAAIFYRAYLRDHRKTGMSLDYALDSIEGMGLAQASPALAARLLGAAAGLRQRLHTPARQGWSVTRDRLAAERRAALGDAAWAALWRAGDALTLEQALAEAIAQSGQDSAQGA